MAKKIKKKLKTLKRINSNKALEKKIRYSINQFNENMLNSLNYWLTSQFNKYFRGEVKSLSNALKVEFNELTKRWNNKAVIFANRISKYINKQSIKYVNSNLSSQGFKVGSDSSITKQILQANMDEHLALIKSIPQETILRYKSALYNNIGNFNLEALNKQIKVISKVSKKRAKTIARDQVAKTIESYHMSRSKDLGFEYYVWNTILDERTSTGKGGHRILNNRIYRYDNPTAIIDSYGNLGKPSQRVNCRCTGTALILQPGEIVKKVKDNINGDYYIVLTN